MKLQTLAVVASLAAAPALAQEGRVDRYRVPDTVSPEAAAALRGLYGLLAQRPRSPPPVTVADFDRAAAEAEARIGPGVRAFAAKLGVVTVKDTLGGVPVLRIRPPGWRPTGRTLIYVHGGGYVLFSAETTLSVPAQIAVAGGDEVISIDYTLAPHADWRATTDQVTAVWRAELAAGVKPDRAALMGDSAGGGLAAGSVLKFRDLGLPLPGALYLLSPWSDITATGDSYTTLAAADPALTVEGLAPGATAYAKPADQKNPYVSPVYGDYRKPFPATLIQVGTREIFLSNAVRHVQAIRSGGHEAVLDVYEGMPHVHPALIPGTPEATAAIRRGVEFLHAHLQP